MLPLLQQELCAARRREPDDDTRRLAAAALLRLVKTGAGSDAVWMGGVGPRVLSGAYADEQDAQVLALMDDIADYQVCQVAAPEPREAALWQDYCHFGTRMPGSGVGSHTRLTLHFFICSVLERSPQVRSIRPCKNKDKVQYKQGCVLSRLRDGWVR